MFSEKIDSLMNTTKTTNAAMGVELGVVPSYISRIRNGTRNLSKSPDIIDHIAEYFSKLELTALQKKNIAFLLSVDVYPENPNDAKELIYHWLFEKETDETPDALKKQKSVESYGDIELYLGIKGKQDAVIKFLTEVRDCKSRQTLLLYSDEAMDWMIDPSFLPKWKSLITEVLEKGNKIKIIHTVKRNSSELTAAIYSWVGLYTTGLIYPYYCPESEGKYRRTLFIAPKTAVITSQSLVDKCDSAPNLYVTDSSAIEAFTKEYNDFVSTCKPLMQRYLKKSPAFMSLVNACSKQTGDSYFFQPSFTDPNVPISMESSEFYHIVCLNPSEKDKVKAYVKKILKEMKKDEHYHVVISQDNSEPYSLYLKENVGVFIITRKGMPISFFFNEENLKYGFSVYLKSKIANAKISDRNAVIEELENYIKK